MRSAFLVDLTSGDRFAKDLEVGGIYIPGATGELHDECHVVLRAGTDEISVTARVVLVDEEGAGFEIEGLTRELRKQISGLVEISKHAVDLERKKTITRTLAETDPTRRRALGSIAPATQRGDGRRVAQGSISPITALAPTQEDDSLANQATAPRVAADEVDDDDP
jgi:hypothetical protein